MSVLVWALKRIDHELFCQVGRKWQMAERIHYHQDYQDLKKTNNLGLGIPRHVLSYPDTPIDTHSYAQRHTSIFLLTSHSVAVGLV